MNDGLEQGVANRGLLQAAKQAVSAIKKWRMATHGAVANAGFIYEAVSYLEAAIKREEAQGEATGAVSEVSNLRTALRELLEIELARIGTGAFKPTAEAQRRVDNARRLLALPPVAGAAGTVGEAK